jgi:dinuclear metal center YbgI/SA1388 family protein
MKTQTVVRFINSILKPRSISDSSRNGLQHRGKPYIDKICSAVDASLDTIELAGKKNCGLLIVHHGLLWKGGSYKKIIEQRLRALSKAKINLYASHLPLDMHPRFGNNIVIAKLLGLKDIEGFGKYNDSYIGFKGIISKMSFKQLLNHIKESLSINPKVIVDPQKPIRSIAVVSGSGDLIEEAYSKKIGCLITGDFRYGRHQIAKEAGLGLVTLGHYNSERFGVIALGRHVRDKYNLEFEFIDLKSDY